MEIKTFIKPNDTVYWVKEKWTPKKGKRFVVYEATVEEVSLCEYQGALYCTLNCPDFKINPHPNVHYSQVFTSKVQAENFAEALKTTWKGRGL